MEPRNFAGVRRTGLGAAAVVVLSGAACGRGPKGGTLAPDSATVLVHYIARPVGAERFVIEATDSGYALRSQFSFVERGSEGGLDATLFLDRELNASEFSAVGRTYRFVPVDLHVIVHGDEGAIEDLGVRSDAETSGAFFPARGYGPLAGRVPLIAYWERRGRPASIRPVPGRPADSIVVEFRGVDTVVAGERRVPLRRYAVRGVVWGREAVWLDEEGRFAAVLSRFNILPLEGIRSDLADALPALQAIAVRDRMDDLAAFAASAHPVVAGDFALVGTRVIDATGAPPVDDAVVVVRGDRIEAVGPRGTFDLPEDVAQVDARGTTVVPGLWDMHGHVSQIEWAGAYLATGVTTARDMGGEPPFLTAFRDAIESGRALGPRLVLAGLVDGEDSLSFGMVTATTPAEGRQVVERYHDQGFLQMKLYTRLRPEVVTAIIARAHELGMSVTGHIPRMLTLSEALMAGMDQVAHLPLRGTPQENRRAIAELATAGTVVDPTAVWGELLGRSRDTPIAGFEPGIDVVAGPLAANYQGASSDATPEAVAVRLRQTLALIKALHDAGVPIVAGTDGAVPGFSVVRELELYVMAGLTPLQALQAGTIVPARAMGLDAERGTIETGKQADLFVVEGNPLEDISSLRRGRWVVTRGRIFRSEELRQ